MTITVTAVQGIGEVGAGTDLASLIGSSTRVTDGDIVLVTSKIVSKAEGQVFRAERDDAVARESVRTVARRGATLIVQNHLGLVMAAAGVDTSNVDPGHVLLLPKDPDASARHIRNELHGRLGRNVAVLISDTAGRPWRNGQTDIAIGLAGLEPIEDFSGRSDPYGNLLAVTAPAIADELAGIGEVASGKLGQCPLVIISGLADRVMPVGAHGPGAQALVRRRGEDMFALGTRQAVITALSGGDATLFGSPASSSEMQDALTQCGIGSSVVRSGTLAVQISSRNERLRALALSHRWRVMGTLMPGRCLLRPMGDAKSSTG